MVEKCINPYCNRPFRYMGHGKLFVTEYPLSVAGGPNHVRRREHFWLCEECCRSMSVAIRHEHEQVAIRIINLSPNGRRKLDFVPEEDVRPAVFDPQPVPEFSFESAVGF